MTTHPRLLLPPPVYLAATIALAVGLQYVWPLDWLLGMPWRLLAGAACCTLALALALWAMLRFRAAKTHVEPHKATTALVRSGPYRFSRNPIYLGFLLLTAGLALLVANPWGLVLLPLLWAALRYFVIRVEEAFLLQRFGDAYADFRTAVRRWI